MQRLPPAFILCNQPDVLRRKPPDQRITCYCVSRTTAAARPAAQLLVTSRPRHSQVRACHVPICIVITTAELYDTYSSKLPSLHHPLCSSTSPPPVTLSLTVSPPCGNRRSPRRPCVVSSGELYSCRPSPSAFGTMVSCAGVVAVTV